MKELFVEVDRYYEEMVSLRRYLHERPELSYEEVHTPAFIATYLQELGIDVRTGVGGRGVVGTIRGGKPGKTVALRADFDALALQDEKDVPYRSKVDGAMHACGHDGHTATLLVVAKILAEKRETLSGNVVLIHQFGEELAPGGAKPMIEDGCLDGVDVVFGAHLWASMPTGFVSVRPGPVMAAADKFTIKVHGRGGHGASPHETVDSIMLGTSYIQQVQQVVSRRINPLQPAVVTVAAFHAGGAFNVIADSAEILGTVRTFDKATQEHIIVEMERLLSGLCDGYGATYKFEYEKGYPAVVNHITETMHLEEQAVEIIGRKNVVHQEPIMGGEDFAYYTEKVPGSFFFVGAGNPAKGASYPHHHPKFDFDEEAMRVAAKVFLSTTVSYLENACKSETTVV
ncbi:amidohydrolase [Mangrovibacillus cuniculi]|uniref:Amidohydrolase n=1 Tax=Mangrovibacillus cuniculi TaxID=2593652 RepID=A0A7S8CD38_9BACI|nr:amidohydrolase [Mangrovibacillus cuniculi]QPC47578.1 amidohydrolase [Mangrovibacillus cuniculi]